VRVVLGHTVSAGPDRCGIGILPALVAVGYATAEMDL
jgi:hypothetical protein